MLIHREQIIETHQWNGLPISPTVNLAYLVFFRANAWKLNMAIMTTDMIMMMIWVYLTALCWYQLVFVPVQSHYSLVHVRLTVELHAVAWYLL